LLMGSVYGWLGLVWIAMEGGGWWLVGREVLGSLGFRFRRRLSRLGIAIILCDRFF
jgi:hypothetical protein